MVDAKLVYRKAELVSRSTEAQMMVAVTRRTHMPARFDRSNAVTETDARLDLCIHAI